MEDAISGISQAGLSSRIGMTVLRKAMDAQEQQGEALIKMIRELEPEADAGDTGGLDVYA